MRWHKWPYLVYAYIEGVRTQLFIGTFKACLDFVTEHPRGPWGGSTHIDTRLS